MTSERKFNKNDIAKNINFYQIWIISLESAFYKNETIVEQQFTYKLCLQTASWSTFSCATH